VSKTVSLPIDLLNAVLDEAEVTGKDFSNTTTMLLRIGIDMRRSARIREEDAQREEARRILNSR